MEAGGDSFWFGTGLASETSTPNTSHPIHLPPSSRDRRKAKVRLNIYCSDIFRLPPPTIILRNNFSGLYFLLLSLSRRKERRRRILFPCVYFFNTEAEWSILLLFYHTSLRLLEGDELIVYLPELCSPFFHWQIHTHTHTHTALPYPFILGSDPTSHTPGRCTAHGRLMRKTPPSRVPPG